MTNFLVVYFLLWIAGIGTIVSFIWRYWVLYIASGLAWGIVAIYSLVHSHGGADFVWAFTFFCFAMAFVMMFAYYWVPRLRMKRGETTPFNTAEDWETPQGKKQFNKMWGQPHKEVEAKEESKAERRTRGEWVD